MDSSDHFDVFISMLPLKNFLGVVEKEDSAVVGIILIRLNRVEGYQKTFTMNNYNYLLWYDGLDLLLREGDDPATTGWTHPGPPLLRQVLPDHLHGLVLGSTQTVQHNDHRFSAVVLLVGIRDHSGLHHQNKEPMAVFADGEDNKVLLEDVDRLGPVGHSEVSLLSIGDLLSVPLFGVEAGVE